MTTNAFALNWGINLNAYVNEATIEKSTALVTEQIEVEYGVIARLKLKPQVFWNNYLTYHSFNLSSFDPIGGITSTNYQFKYLSLRSMFDYRFPFKLSLTAGFNISYLLDSNFNSTTTTIVFMGDNTYTHQSGNISGAKQWRVGFVSGVKYEYDFKQFLIIPHLTYDLGVTKTVNNQVYSLKIDSVKLGVDILF